MNDNYLGLNINNLIILLYIRSKYEKFENLNFKNGVAWPWNLKSPLPSQMHGISASTCRGNIRRSLEGMVVTP